MRWWTLRRRGLLFSRNWMNSLSSSPRWSPSSVSLYGPSTSDTSMTLLMVDPGSRSVNIESLYCSASCRIAQIASKMKVVGLIPNMGGYVVCGEKKKQPPKKHQKNNPPTFVWSRELVRYLQEQLGTDDGTQEMVRITGCHYVTEIILKYYWTTVEILQMEAWGRQANWSWLWWKFLEYLTIITDRCPTISHSSFYRLSDFLTTRFWVQASDWVV